MKKLIAIVVALILFAFDSSAQLGGLLKKKNKEKTEAVDSTQTDKVEKNEEKKKGGGFFQKVVGKIAKTAGNSVMGASGMTAIGDLKEADVIVSMGTNIYSKDLGLMLTDFLGKDWVNNGDFTMLQIASKDAFQFYKYDGAIKVNDKELKHVSMGIHTATEAPGTGNKKITFEKAGTVEGSFEIPMPSKNIKLISINGQKEKIKIDFTKDVLLELENVTSNADDLVRVDVITTQIGIRTLSMVAYVKPATRVSIPAAAFRNIENTNNFNFKGCYLSVSQQSLVKAINPTGAIPATQMVITGSNDGKWVDVTASNKNENGFVLKSGNAITTKGNAAYSKPLAFAKKTAVSSFYTNGTTYLYDTDKNNWTQTSSTKTIDFPEIPDTYLDAMLDNLYNKITTTYNEITGSEILPASTIPALPAYANTVKFFPGEVNNDGEFLRAYKDLQPTRTLSSVSNRYYGDGQLLKEAGADALLKVSLVCQLSWDSKPTMTPYLTVELVGEANGDFRSFVGNTKYFSMNIKGDGYELKKKAAVDFDKVFQVDELTSQFKKALSELKAKEATIADYEQVWKVQE